MPSVQPYCEDSPVDLAKLRKRCMGVEPFVWRVLQQLMASGQQSLAQIERAVSAGDTAALSAAAHRLKGAVSGAAAAHLEQLCQRIESESHSMTQPELQQLLPPLRQAWNDLRQWVEAHKPTPSSRTM